MVGGKLFPFPFFFSLSGFWFVILFYYFKFGTITGNKNMIGKKSDTFWVVGGKRKSLGLRIFRKYF